MTAGKLVKSFPQGQGSILSLQFSPSEFIMVTLDADSFNVVDLQTFDHVKLPLRKANEQSTPLQGKKSFYFIFQFLLPQLASTLRVISYRLRRLIFFRLGNLILWNA